MQYDHATRQRAPLPDVDLERAIVIHLPAGTGTCELVWVNISAGWEAVKLAGHVRRWRARKDLATPVNPPFDNALVKAITAARTVEELEAVWAQYADVWTDADTRQAAAKKELLLSRAGAA